VRKAFKRSKNSNEPPKLYAVKIFRSGDPEIVNTIKKTYNISRFLHHPSVARTFELYLNEKTEIANLVMEYCPYPSLEEIIRRK
jgi:calcium-dependent protein kinase